MGFFGVISGQLCIGGSVPFNVGSLSKEGDNCARMGDYCQHQTAIDWKNGPICGDWMLMLQSMNVERGVYSSSCDFLVTFSTLESAHNARIFVVIRGRFSCVAGVFVCFCCYYWVGFVICSFILLSLKGLVG